MPKRTRRPRRAYALISTVGLIFLLTVLLGVMMSHLGYSSDVMEAYTRRFQARNALESMTNLSLKWLSAEVRINGRPGAEASVSLENLTDFDSLRIFASNDFDGCEVKIYNLDYSADKVTKPVDAFGVILPCLPGGYMIRATTEKEGLAPLTLESVYLVTINTLPDGNTVEVLDEKPVYWRVLFRK